MPLGVAGMPTRDAGVSKFKGELRSISEERSWSCGGGEENRGAPGLEDMTLRRDAGGEVMSASIPSSCCGGERTWSAAEAGAVRGGGGEEGGREGEGERVLHIWLHICSSRH